MSKISHILMKNPVVVPTGAKLSEAVALLKKNKVTSLLVSRNNKLAGVISVVDIAYGMPGGNRDITVDEVMHSPEITIDSDKWITDALEIFRRCNVSHVTVVENGEKVGIIRAEDILHTYRFNNQPERHKEVKNEEKR
ncbi:MAG: CBS domain-containing protein [Candidatus Methanoperedens sp.]|nr:CBS domain-containing protein [Candidatus Methanoperedens sp.]MCZ7405694.1 CBS domain-containing protein [Candidatus Methanoperedens sp.]